MRSKLDEQTAAIAKAQLRRTRARLGDTVGVDFAAVEVCDPSNDTEYYVRVCFGADEYAFHPGPFSRADADALAASVNERRTINRADGWFV